MKFIISLYLLVLVVNSSSVAARSCAPSKNIEGLIEILHEFEGESEPVLVKFSFPNKYEEYEFSSISLQRNSLTSIIQDDFSSYVHIVPETKMREDQQTGFTVIGVEELAKWSLRVGYAIPIEKSVPEYWWRCNSIVTTTSLEHNKKRNDVDGSEEPPIR